MKKFIISLFLLIFLFSPIFVLAQNSTSQAQLTQQLIQLLQQTIVKLQQQIADILAKRAIIQTTTPAVTTAPVVVSTNLTGTFDLVKDPSYNSQSFITPQRNFKLAEFSLTNNTNEPINLNNIKVDPVVNSGAYIINPYVSGLYVVYDSNKTTVLNVVTHDNSLQVNYALPVGKKINVSLYADVSPSIPINSTINSSVLIAGMTAFSKTVVSTNSNVILGGQSIVFSTGSLAVSQDSSTPASKIVVSNQRTVAGKFKITATADSYNVSEFKFVIPGASNILAVPEAVLLDAQTQAVIATAPIINSYNNNNSTFIFNTVIPISINSTKSFLIAYDLSTVSRTTTLNANLAPALIYIKAISSNGTMIDGIAGNYNNIVTASNGKIDLPDSGVTFNSLYAVKSMPIFSAGQLAISGSNNYDLPLYTFSIGADPSGNVSVKQLTFQITINDPNFSNPALSDFKIFKGNSNYTSSVSMGNIINDNYVALTNNNGIGVGLKNVLVLVFNDEEVIPAGVTNTYTLRAAAKRFVNVATLGADSVSTQMLADDSAINSNSYLWPIKINLYYGLAQMRGSNTYSSCNLLWSDKSSNDHNDSSNYSSNDWYNGFEVLNLPLPSQTINAK